MTISISDLLSSINKAYRLIKPRRADLNNFKNNLLTLLGHIDDRESEENVKIHLMDFLKSTFYHPDYLIATKGRTDFVIHLGKDAKSHVGVLFEVKKPTNKADMISKTNLNAKGMHELILYFLRERLNNKNNSLTHLIITNIYEWFVFDAALFERIFTENKNLQKSYKEWEGGQKVSSKTDLFYREIIKPFLLELNREVNFTYFNLKDYETFLKTTNDRHDKQLIPLYKFFTPPHLLKLPFINDANFLDKGFFAELLHIVGLKEYKEGGKKVIKRLPPAERNPGSFIENALNILEVENALRKIPLSYIQGNEKDEQVFNVALELCIIWVNRILFLKLLEAQLLRYHNNNSKYRFLNIHTIRDYDELYKLFFQVLAKENSQRTVLIKEKYHHIPYLNSSLFEISELEDITIKINGLDDNLELTVYNYSIIKKNINRKDTKSLNTLQYFFEFLDAYDFSSIGKEDIQEENKPIINAAVLGLVFEKINGYKDGAFYTPGAITMFLCKETITRTVIKKFNDQYNWKCETLDDLRNFLADKKTTKEILEFNQLIESIQIIDPAVGSGHFLVSSLNELIAIKDELGILADETGKRISHIEVSIANDELVILNRDSQSFFEYVITESNDNGEHLISKEIQHIQKTLFNEKRKIIEKCLFGVDINTNSVKICQLRLWIELLKHAYYKPETKYSELETLPNIDINIKEGNSLLSKFNLDEDLTDVFQKQKFGVKDYRLAVETYKEAPNKETKAQLLQFLKIIKEQFRQTVARRDPKRKNLSELRGRLTLAQNNVNLFGQQRTEEEMQLEVNKLSQGILKLETEISEIENNVVYRHAFEWRFEFPEVLNDKGNYEGFDIVIGNPPYIQLQKMSESADMLQKANYKTFSRTGDIYCLFYELAIRLLKPGYYFGFITSNKWMRANYGIDTRNFFIEHTNPLLLLDFGGYQVFDSATVDTNILISQKAANENRTQSCLFDKHSDSLEKMSDYFRQNSSVVNDYSIDKSWVLLNKIERLIKQKVEQFGTPLKNWDIQINYGIKTGFNEAFIINETKRNELIQKSPKAADIIRPILRGRDIQKFHVNWEKIYLIGTHNGYTNLEGKYVSPINIQDYPTVKEHLDAYWSQIESRYDQGATPYNLRSCIYMEDFFKPKIIWGEISDRSKFAYDEADFFVEATSFLMTGENLKYLLGMLNSKLLEWYFNQIGTATGVGTNRWKKYTIELLPVKKPTKNELVFLENLVNQTMLNSNEFTDENLIQKINNFVYNLYDLSEEEVAFISQVNVSK